MRSLLGARLEYDPRRFSGYRRLGRLVRDSRRVEPGDVFFAMPGASDDGRRHIAEADERGAALIFYESGDGFAPPPLKRAQGAPVANLRELSGLIASDLLGRPSQKLRCYGVTGTNGKTSVSQWLAQAEGAMGRKCAVVGTLGWGFPGSLRHSDRTTPDAADLQQELADFVGRGAEAVAMEVSSHALELARVNGVAFDVAVFTNLSRDHLDFHGTMERYAQAKLKLFAWEGLKGAAINGDDPVGRSYVERLAALRGSEGFGGFDPRVVTYGFGEESDVRVESWEQGARSMSLSLATPWGRLAFASPTLGRFNAQNLAAAASALLLAGFAPSDVEAALARIRPAQGRMQIAHLDGPSGAASLPTVVVDYAHTPDALEKTLQALRPSAERSGGRLWAVFGCGGDRDPGKRPMMGEMATRLADETVVTSDNPRFEDPLAIIDGVTQGGALSGSWRAIPDRAEAIAWAIAQADPRDVLLIAGKGHEDYQDAKGVKTHFDDMEIALRELGKRA